jgi:hypothetical protein
MSKIITSLFVFAISFSLTANAQMNSIEVVSVEGEQGIDAVSIDAPTITPIAVPISAPVLQKDVSKMNIGDSDDMQARKRLEAEQVRAKVQLQNEIEIKRIERINKEESILFRDKVEDGIDMAKDKAELLRERAEEGDRAIGETIKNRIEVTKESAIRTITQIKNKVMYDRELTSEKARELINKAKEEREDFVSRSKVLKVELQDKRKIEQEELQNKIQLLKDEKKREVVVRIDNNLNNLSSRFTEKWSETLDKLDEWTIKIIDKIAVESANGKDVTNANATINEAKSAMLSARTAIESQLEKTYPVAITTEENLKSDVSAVRTRLNTDLKSIKDSIQEAHKSVVNALVEFNKIIKSVEIDNN